MKAETEVPFNKKYQHSKLFGITMEICFKTLLQFLLVVKEKKYIQKGGSLIWVG